ncbi:MAG TPA: hypothetical protein P5526_19845 [Anaerolineae bacterium]|nr:hypothetical protein [Anaerolineae bacterium]
MAGILFSLLLMISMVLITTISTANPADISRDRLETRANTVSLALGLVPFAGIAFLWFTGVMRDQLGEQEDQFFATVFLGSGLIFVMLIFVWAATVAAIYGTLAADGNNLVDKDIFIFGFGFMNEIVGNYALRMAGVYMLSSGTLWARTGVMPRWVIIITYLLALGFLFFAGSIRGTRFIFPSWVFLVSVYVLIVNRRLDR